MIRAEDRPEGDLLEHPTVQALRERFGEALRNVGADALGYPVARIDADQNHEVLRFLRDDPDQAFDLLADITGVDVGDGTPLQVWYQLWSMRHGRQLRVS